MTTLPDRCRGTEILYVSYDGLLEPLGQSQIVSYLIKLSAVYSLSVLSFEKPRDLQQREKVEALNCTLRRAGVRWVRKRYHKWPPVGSTVFDVLRGMVAGLLLCRREPIQVIHARGYVPALIGLFLKRVMGLKLLFDMRGFWADEKVDGGHWSRHSLLYAVTKRCERSFYESADGIVSLTQEGVKLIPELGYQIPRRTCLTVIPTCVDLDRFTPEPKNQALLERLGLTGSRVIGCVGTMSNWYLRRSMLDYLAFLTTRRSDLKILIVTQEDHDRLRSDARDAGVPMPRLVLAQADFTEMPAYVRLMDLSMFFIKVCFSKRGSAATKMAEFLACGVPVIINDGIGDSGWIIRQERAGVVLHDTTARDFEESLQGIQSLLDDSQAPVRCRAAAGKYFSLDRGVRKYVELYRELLEQNIDGVTIPSEHLC